MAFAGVVVKKGQTILHQLFTCLELEPSSISKRFRNCLGKAYVLPILAARSMCANEVEYTAAFLCRSCRIKDGASRDLVELGVPGVGRATHVNHRSVR